MSDRSFQIAVKLIGEAKRCSSDVATKLIFDRYTISSQAGREALVLALVGEVLTASARKASDPGRDVPRPEPAAAAAEKGAAA